MLKEKIKGKIGRKALIINLGFEANVGPAGLCDRGAAAAAPTAPVRHGQNSNSGPKSTITKGTGLAGGGSSGSALVISECRKRRTENACPIQNTPQPKNPVGFSWARSRLVYNSNG